jgi:hypothetical protein
VYSHRRLPKDIDRDCRQDVPAKPSARELMSRAPIRSTRTASAERTGRTVWHPRSFC